MRSALAVCLLLISPAYAGTIREAADAKLLFAIPEKDRKGTGVRLVTGKIAGEYITMTFLNDSDQGVQIGGTGLDSPFYSPEIPGDRDWEWAHGFSFCGVGAFKSRVPAGFAFRFQARIPDEARLFRIWLDYEREHKTAGSEPAEVHSEPVDHLPTRIRDSSHIMDVSIYEEELVTLPFEVHDGITAEEARVKLVKRGVVTRVHKGEIKVGDRVQYARFLLEPPGDIRSFRSGVQGEPRTLFFSRDAFSKENGRYVMDTEDHYSFSRVESDLAGLFDKEVKDNPALSHVNVALPQTAPDHDRTENTQALIRENDYIVDISIYEEEWTPPVPATTKGILRQRAVVTGVHKGDIKVGALLEYFHQVETWSFPRPFRSVVEGELLTFFFLKEDSTLKDGKYTIGVNAHFGFTPQEDGFATTFAKELETNRELRGSYRAARAKAKE